MNWFRAHHGISNDIKFALIAARLNVPRCEVGWMFLILLDHASQNTEDRGNIGSLSPDEIAMMAGVSTERVAQIMEAFRDREMLTGDGRLTSWDKRQPKRERPDDDSTERVQQHRQRKRHVTPCNATEHQETPRTEQNRTDKSRAEQNRLGEIDVGEPQYPVQSRRVVSMAEAWEGFDFEGWFESRYAKHPKKVNRGPAAQLLSQLSGVNDPKWRRMFEARHDAWIATPGWQKEGGQYAPPFDRWIVDKGYNYDPPKVMSETEKAWASL